MDTHCCGELVTVIVPVIDDLNTGEAERVNAKVTFFQGSDPWDELPYATMQVNQSVRVGEEIVMEYSHLEGSSQRTVHE